MKPKRKWRWVTTDGQRNELIDIWPQRKKPKLIQGYITQWTADPNEPVRICEKEFRKLTGVTVPHDKPIKVLFNARVTT
jgi:hypothetical protein